MERPTKEQIISKFNRRLEQFINRIKITYPILTNTCELLEDAIKSNHKIGIAYFTKYIFANERFCTYIRNFEYDAFNKRLIVEECADNEFAGYFREVFEAYKSASKAQKTEVFKYLNRLLMLSEQYSSYQ